MRTAVQEKFHDPRSSRLAHDMSVLTRDGIYLGSVKRINGIYFETVPPSGRAFWLNRDRILYCDFDEVTLTLDEAQVDEHRLSRPRGERWEPPVLDALEDGLLSEDERRRQRERMERELSEQRERSSTSPVAETRS
jgi:hypothetical protein